MTTQTKNRLLYIDNIRILLISLIVLLHLVITYGGPGDWYIPGNKVRKYRFDI